MVARAISTKAAGAVESAPTLGTPVAPPQEETKKAAVHPPPGPDELVALIAMGIAIPTRLYGSSCGLSRTEIDEISSLRPDERKALSALAPYAVDSVPFLAAHAKPLCAAAVGIIVAALVGYRISTIKRIARARSESVHRDDGNGKDSRGSGGFADLFSTGAESDNSRPGGQSTSKGFDPIPDMDEVRTRDG